MCIQALSFYFGFNKNKAIFYFEWCPFTNSAYLYMHYLTYTMIYSQKNQPYRSFFTTISSVVCSSWTCQNCVWSSSRESDKQLFSNFYPNARMNGSELLLSVLRRPSLAIRCMILVDIRVVKPDVLVLYCSASTFDKLQECVRVVRHTAPQRHPHRGNMAKSWAIFFFFVRVFSDTVK